MNIKEIVAKMSLEDKITLCSGRDFWNTPAMEQYGISSIMLANGPHGLSKQTDANDMMGISKSVPATCFPAAVSTGCSWDEELLSEIGEAIGREASENEVAVVLGPGANIKRNPLCGRNFEYYSEDPFLSGKLAAAWIRGMEKTGVRSCLKHFALNNQEHQRFTSDSVADERTMREIYLAGFEIAVKEGRPSTVMSAYNKINGEYCSGNRRLLSDILRAGWGFHGLVMSDWGGMSDRVKSFQSGCDLCMPGGSSIMTSEALLAVNEGRLNEKDIDRSTERILNLIFSGVKHQQTEIKNDLNDHHSLARKAAEESAVLLKNEGNTLPLQSTDGLVFIGHMAGETRFQGTGSSRINPWKMSSVTEACPDVLFVEGCDANGGTDTFMLNEATQAAKSARTAVVFAGLPSAYESEGFDRESMKMPEGHLQLIDAVSSVNSNTVVVLICGSAVETPWADKVKAILYMGLPGQAGGEAIVNLLFGKAVPSGKLAESWPVCYKDCVSSSYYGKDRKDAHYREGIYVGYRYYATAGKTVRFPFGHGLSYTTFHYSEMTVKGDCAAVHVTNTGGVAAKEIIQLYISPPRDRVYRPVKELKAFAKVLLQPGETKAVPLQLHERSFAFWDEAWVIQGGSYIVSIGTGSENLALTATICKEGGGQKNIKSLPVWYLRPQGAPSHMDWETMLGREVRETRPAKGQYTMNNTLSEMKDRSFAVQILYKMIESKIVKAFHGKKDDKNPEFRMMITTANQATLRLLKIMAGKSNYVMEGVLEMANGRFFRGLGLMLRKARQD